MKARRTQPPAHTRRPKSDAGSDGAVVQAVDEIAVPEHVGDESREQSAEHSDSVVLPTDRPAALRTMPANDANVWPDVLTIDELAALLRLDNKTVYAAVARGEIPGVRRIGRVLRASREAVLAWLREGRVSRSRRK
jgi:excisionase family DNA binding protein